MSAPMFELQLKNRELQKHLFNIIGAGTKTPEFLIQKKFEEENKTLDIEYFAMADIYKAKKDITNLEIQKFVEENKDQLKKEYIDFNYVTINPKNLIGINEFNQEFFDKIDDIENKISQGDTFPSIINELELSVTKVEGYTPSSKKNINKDIIYSNRSAKIDLLENGDDFLLFSITNKYDRGPNLNDETTKTEIKELVYQKNKFDFNREILEKIQDKKFDDNKFKEMGDDITEYLSLKSINDIEKFETNSIKMLYALPINSFTLVNDKDNDIFLVKIVNFKKKSF
jgi:peptidyl-prolyl cis-trans isomerase D